MYLIILLWFIVAVIEGQRFNLGTLNLGRNPSGDLELDFGQGGQFLGFGGDRSLGLLIGPGRLGAKSDGGLLLGGQRLGIDSNFGYQEGRGLNLGSLLQLGNKPGYGYGYQTGVPSADASSWLGNFGTPLLPASIDPSQKTVSSVPHHSSTGNFVAGEMESVPPYPPPSYPTLQPPSTVQQQQDRFPPSTGPGWNEELESKVRTRNSVGTARLELPASDADDRELLLTHKNTNLTAVNEKDEQNSDGINSKKSPQREKEQLPVPEGLEPIHKYNRVFSRFYGLSERIV